MQNGNPRRDRQTSDPPTQDLVLVYRDALRICEKHGHRKAALQHVNALSFNATDNAATIAKLCKEQFAVMTRDLVECVRRAQETKAKLKHLPVRADQGAALRDIRQALERLRGVVRQNWNLIKPLVEIETAEHMEKLLTGDAIQELLPAALRYEYSGQLLKTSKFGRREINLAYVLKAELHILTRVIKGAKIVVRRAEKRNTAGAPMKAPLEVALIMQLADHYEWALQKKASSTEGGPFSRFCSDVFHDLNLKTAYDFDYLVKESLKLHGRSLVGRLGREQRGDAQITPGRARKRKPQKQKLVGLTKQKMSK